MAERTGKTGQVTLGVWFDEEAGDIHLSITGHGLSTVNGYADSKRGNPHLYNKLARVLRDQGKPHPAIVEEWGGGGCELMHRHRDLGMSR